MEMDCSNESNELRLLAVGKTGSGVSSTANSILGEQCFHTQHSASSITCRTHRGERYIDGRNVVIAETPGFLNTGIDESSILSEIRRGIQLLHPGPHVILYTISKHSRYSDDDASTFISIFGKSVYPYVIVVFTGNDDQDWETLEQYSRNMTMSSKEFFDKFDQRSVHINNKSKQTERQMRIKQLFEIINNTTAINMNDNCSYFSEEMMPRSISDRIKERVISFFKNKRNKLNKLFVAFVVGGTLFYFIYSIL